MYCRHDHAQQFKTCQRLIINLYRQPWYAFSHPFAAHAACFSATSRSACTKTPLPTSDFAVTSRNRSIDTRNDTGEPSPIGIDGEIWVRGYTVMLGYYKNEEATREAINQAVQLAPNDPGLWVAQLAFDLRADDTSFVFYRDVE